MITIYRLLLLCCALFAAVSAIAEVAADSGSVKRDPQGLDLQRIEMPWTGDLDGIIVGTCSQDTLFPSTACWVQHALGVKGMPAFDVMAGCSSIQRVAT